MSSEKNSQSGNFFDKVRHCVCEDKLLNALVISLSSLCVLLTLIAIYVTIESVFSSSSVTALGIGAITALPWLVVALAAFLFVRRYIAK